ncbi:MAG: sigma-70 family RNA polymerase sigma factor [Acidobacteria bacterium]|nr:sigma-70 family RNA polymerase sigma factor [Acidobacteriota bacterium]
MIEDPAVIRECRNGSREAWTELMERHGAPLFSFCLRLARNRDEADDLFQDTWVKTVAAIGTFDETRRFAPWLFTLCINRHRDLCRRRQRWWKRVRGFVTRSGEDGEDEVSRLPAPVENGEERLMRSEEESAMRRCVDALGEAVRTTVLLFYFGGFEIVEIAGMLGVPEGTVKSRLAAGRAKIKAMWEDGR